MRIDLLPVAIGEGWMVVEKPAGISIHNEPGRDLITLMAPHVVADGGFGIHAVHRLDRETSGIILLAYRRAVFEALSREFAAGRVIKEYWAVAHGHLPLEEEGCWDWPLNPNEGGRSDPQGRGDRVACITHFSAIRHSPHYSMLRCRPATGRRHQIRRHAALAGHPVVGDRRYGSLRACRFLESKLGFSRLGLHSAALTIRMPGQNEPRHFASAKLPKELEELLSRDN